MSRRYTVSGALNAAGTAAATCLTIVGGSSVIVLVDSWQMGPLIAPNSTDSSVRVFIRRLTADGTGTSATPLPTGENQVAATSTAKTAHTVEPTYVAGQNLLDVSFNQRASFQIQVQDGRELCSVAGSGNGIGAGMTSANQSYQLLAQVWYKE